MRALRALVAVAAVAAVPLMPVSADAADQAAAQPALTRAKAAKLAKAAVLTPKDFPGFRVERDRVEPGHAEDDAAFYACVKAPMPTYRAQNPGFTFSRGALDIGTSAYVVSTGRAARADMKVAAGSRTLRCLQRAMLSTVEEQGAKAKVSVRRVPVKVDGADAVVGFRYDVRGSFSGDPVQLRGYSVAALVGQTQFSVDAVRYDGRRPELPTLEALAAKAAKRVAAL